MVEGMKKRMSPKEQSDVAAMNNRHDEYVKKYGSGLQPFGFTK